MWLWVLLLLNIFFCLPNGLNSQHLPDMCYKSCQVNVCDVECTLPKLPDNGRYVVLGAGQTSTPTPGAPVKNSTVLYYSCNSGYTPVAAKTAICLHGQWVTDFRQCQKIAQCSLPQLPTNGGYNIIGDPNPPNPGSSAAEWTALTFFCDSSFTLIGQNTAVCQNGQWSSNPPTCKKTNQCVLPAPPEYGQYQIVGSANPPVPGQTVPDLTVLSFTCMDHLTLIGDAVAVCSGGTWMGKFPTCSGEPEYKHCTVPNPPTNGGYLLVGSSSPPVPGSIVKESSTLQFSCNPGFQLVGSESSTCTSGRWSPEVPRCTETKNFCPLPNQPQNGKYAIVGSTIPPIPGQLVPDLTVIYFYCDSNHEISGGETIAVCANGIWLGGGMPVCKPTKQCTLPLYPQNGSYKLVGSTTAVSPGFNVSEKETIQFTCFPNFQMVGAEYSTCLDGSWTTQPPKCVEQGHTSCVVPNAPNRGSMLLVGSPTPPVAGSSVGEKETLQFRCEPGFQLVGKESSTCLGGQWTSEVPTCTEIAGCIVPNPPGNGSLILVGSSTPPTPGFKVNEKEIIEFSCQPGFQLVGKECSVCLGGKWTSEVPVCKEIKYCRLPQPPANGKYVIIGSNVTPIPGSLVPEMTGLYFTCEGDLTLIGGSLALCTNGIWLGSLPTCKKIKYCTLPEFPENGHYSIIGSVDPAEPGFSVEEKETISFVCNPGYHIVGKESSTCFNSAWTSEAPKCEKTETPSCVVPNPPEKGSYTLVGTTTPPVAGSRVNDGSILKFTCQYGLELVGETTSKCYGGKWSSETPKCVEPTGCVVPKPPVGGSASIVGSTTPPLAGSIVEESTILQFTCGSDLVLIGEAQIKCYKTNWSSPVPKCIDKSSCVVPNPPKDGSYTLIATGYKAVPGDIAEEWSTLKFKCNDGFGLVGKVTSTCAGGKWSSEVPVCVGNNGCTLPPFQSNGRYGIQGSQAPPTPGQTTQEATVLLFTCDAGYTLVGPPSTTCSNQKWTTESPKCELQKPIEDCCDVKTPNSGVYVIQPDGCERPFNAYCDMNLDGGKWTVIQSRFDGSVDFFKNYQEYTDGFGLPSAEHWLGLEKIYQITKSHDYELYVELEAFNNNTKSIARYSKFRVGDMMKGYRLTVSGYSGTAGDSMKYHNEMMFSTHDRDQDVSADNCAAKWKGGWWYNNCHFSHLNGLYYTSAVQDSNAMYWYHLFGNTASLKNARMLVRRKQ